MNCYNKKIFCILAFLLFTISAYGVDFIAGTSYTDKLGGSSLSGGQLSFSETDVRRFWHLEFSRTGTYSVYAKVDVSSAEAGCVLRIGDYLPQYGEASTAEATLTATSGTQWQYIGEIIIPETGLHYIFLRFPVLAGSQSGQVEAIRLEGAGQITQGVAWTGRAAAAFYAVGEYTSSRRTKYVEMIPRPWPTPNIGGTHTVASISGSYSHNNSNVAFSLWQSNGLNPTPLVAFGGTRIFTHEGEGSTIELDDFYLDPTRRRKVLIFMTPDGSGNTITAVCAGEVGQGWYLVGRMREYASKTLGSGYGFIENFSVFNAHYYQRACAWGNSWSFGSHSGQNSWLENKSVSADFKNPADNPDPFTTGVYRWGKSGLKQDMVEITIGGQLEQINNGNKIYYTLPSGRPMPVLPTLNLVCTLNEQDEIYQLDDAQVNSNYSENVSTRIKDPFSSIGFNFQKISGPAWLTVSSNGLLSGRPAIGDSGQNLIEIEVYSNNMGLSGIFTIGIYVAAPGNNAPVFLDHPTEVQTVATADDPVLLTFPLHDPDATDTLTLSVVSGDLSGVFGIDQATKSLIKVSVPVADQVYPLTLELSDGTETVTTNVDVTVVQGDGRGGATKDVWYMSIGTTVAELENDPRYPDDPNWTGAVGDLTEDYMGKSTGYRIRGYIYPPVTGSYTFWMTGAQAGEFWLSSDQSSGNIVKRAGFSPTSSSSLVTLSVGQRYYFEALAKCGNYNTGNLQVDWQGPGLFRQVIAGEYISPIEYVRPEYSENTIALREVLVGEPYQENMRTKLKTLDMWDVLVYEKLSGPEWVVVSSDGMLTGTPDDLDVGVNSVLLRATVPGGLYDEVTLEINVNANNAPVFNADPIVLADINENSAYNKSLRSYASDINTGVHFGFGDRLTFGIVSGPGWLHISDDGQLYGTPTDNDAGLNIWTVRVTDLGGLTAETQLEFEVLSQNDYPEFVSDPILMSVMLGDAVVGSLADQCHDPDVGDVLTFSKDDGPAWLIVGEDGSLSGMPADIDEGVNQFTVSVDDGNGGSDQAILKINVLTGVWFVHEPFDGSPGADVIGSAGGTGFDGAWVLGSDGSAGAFTFAGTGMTFTDIETSGLKTVYDPISGATTRYKRSLVSAVTVDAVTTEVWASALVEIGSGSGDVNAGRGIGVELINGNSVVVGFGKKLNSTFGVGQSMTSSWTNSGISAGTVGVRLLVLRLAYNGTDTIATVYIVKDGSSFDIADPTTFTGSASITLPGAVSFDSAGLYAYHSSTTSNAIDEIRVGPSYESVVGLPELDNTPPNPDPMLFDVLPYPSGTYSVTMFARVAYDPNGVEYYFTCTQGSGHNSGWQDSVNYTDSGLSSDIVYTYTVKARDKSANQNETGESQGRSVVIDLYDGRAGLMDFASFADLWLEYDCGFCGGADLTDDGDVDMNDLMVFASNWLD